MVMLQAWCGLQMEIEDHTRTVSFVQKRGDDLHNTWKEGNEFSQVSCALPQAIGTLLLSFIKRKNLVFLIHVCASNKDPITKEILIEGDVPCSLILVAIFTPCRQGKWRTMPHQVRN